MSAAYGGAWLGWLAQGSELVLKASRKILG
jgi:hypothetical protein